MEQTQEKTPTGSITCVVADDHALLRDGLVAMLGDQDGVVVTGAARTGEELRELIAKLRPDVVIVDHELSGAEPSDLAAEIEAPVIVYTGRDDVDRLDAALEAGVRGYVLKSGPPGELVRAIRMVTAGLPFIDPALAGGLLTRRTGPPPNPLSRRETEVLRLLAEGFTTEAAGQKLFLSPTTVRSYAENAMRKLEARNRVHAVAIAVRMGILD
jgi:DNA-binding NarL/FixJ family response regulator